jgi:glucose/mannose-6-phosphate isomerase
MSEGKNVQGTMIFKNTVSFPEQIEAALEEDIPPIPKAGKVCICGMGASALAGEILSDFADGTSKTPLFVIRRTEFPKWVGEDTWTILVSYSGNTKETLIAYDEAIRRNCKVICVTSGGELYSKCLSRRDVAVTLSGGMQSRAALGSIIGRLASILEEMGVCEAKTELKKIVPALKAERDRVVKDDCEVARTIADKLFDKIPVIYSLANMRSSAIRWKTQINENSKNISFCGSIPEFNHNEIVGWTDDRNNNRNFILVVLYDDNASKMMKSMIDTSIDILMDKNLDTIVLHVEGTGNLEKNLKCIILGDIVSLYLADLRSTDPTTEKPLRDVRDRADVPP